MAHTKPASSRASATFTFPCLSACKNDPHRHAILTHKAVRILFGYLMPKS